MWVGHVIWHPGHDTEVLSFIFHHGTDWNVDCVSVVGYDDEDSGRCGSVM